VTGNSAGNCGGDANANPGGAAPYGTRTVPDAADCSGGTIQAVSGADGAVAGSGVYLSGVQNVSLTRMRLTGTEQNFGIRGSGVTNLTLDNVLLDGTFGTSTAVDEGAVSLTNLAGSASVSNSFFSGGFEHDFQVRNTSVVTLNRITLDNVTFGTQTLASASDHLLLTNDVAGTLNATVQNSRFMGAKGDMLQFVDQNGGTSDVVVQNNVFFNQASGIASGGGGVNLATTGTASTFTYNVMGNRMRGASGAAFALQNGAGTSTSTGTVTNNIIGDATVANSGSSVGNAIFIAQAQRGKTKVLVDNNQLSQFNGFAGIWVQAGGAAATIGTNDGALNATIRRNTVGTPGTATTNYVDAVHFENGTNGGDAYTMCLNVGQGAGNANTLTGRRNATDGSGITGAPFSFTANNISVTPANLWFKLNGYPAFTDTPSNAARIESTLQAANTTGGVAGNEDVAQSSSTFSTNSASGKACDLF
jgi:hypothetical protein